ncbi:hypothetical protein GCM10028857_02090 [Salinarchaeum chitinilyticum]
MTSPSAKSRTEEPSAAGDRSTAATDDGGGSDGDEPVPDVSRDLVFDALKNSRRRLVLRHLHERAEVVTLNDLVERVAADENGTTPAELTADQRKRVYVGLYQSHLPRLDDMGFVEFDQSDGTVELGPAGPVVEQYLDVGAEDRRWYQDYVAFLGLTIAVSFVAFLGGLLSIVGAGTVLVGTILGVVGLAAYRWRDERA